MLARFGSKLGRDSIAAALVGVLLSLSTALPAAALPGAINAAFASFGNAGVKILGNSTPSDLVLQPDGKILMVGKVEQDYKVTRLLPNGSLDPTFGVEGRVSLAELNLVGPSLALQPDGKIVVVGTTTASDENTMMVRLTSTGGFDTSFSGDGKVETDVQGDDDRAEAVAILPDGKILVAGHSWIDGDYDFTVTRYLSNGSLDTTFGFGGASSVGFGADEFCSDMVIQPDGKVVMVGENMAFFDTDWAIARLNADGSLDSSFDGDGKKTIGLGKLDEADAVALQADGKIVITGNGDSSDDGWIVRLLQNGSFDSSFDGDGQLHDSESSCVELVVQPNGKILTIGWHESPNGDFQFIITRRNSNGSLNTSFGNGGDNSPDFGGVDRGFFLGLLPGGAIIACGTSDPPGNFVRTALIRLRSDGQVDTGGFIGLSFESADLPRGSNTLGSAIITRTDGRIVATATLANAAGSQSDFAISRLLPNGDPDGSFGIGGSATCDLNDVDVAQAVTTQSDGKTVVAGYTGSTNIQFLVARFTNDGLLDPSFGSGGFTTFGFDPTGGPGPDYCRAIAMTPDQKIVVAGTVHNGAEMVFGVARLNADGSLDTSFDLDGKRTFDLPGYTSREANAVLVQPDGKIVVGGRLDGNFALVRFLTSGGHDTSFSTGIRATFTVVDMGGDDGVQALALETSGPFAGRIYAAGSGGAGQDFALVQLTPSGELWSTGSGWTDGKAFANWGGSESARALDVRHGRVVAAGVANGQLVWAQYTVDSNASPLLSTSALPGTADGTGGVGVQFLMSDQVLVLGTQTLDGAQTVAIAGFETTQAGASDFGNVETIESSRLVRLQPASPNPFRHDAVIAFDLARGQKARLRVFDVGGRLVRTLADGEFGAGRHEARWNGTDRHGRPVAAGVYYATLESGGQRSQRSVVLIR